MESNILLQIKDSEKEAEEAIERAKKESQSILHQAAVNSSKLLAENEEAIRKAQEKKLTVFREKAKLIKEEKIAEGRNKANQIKSKAEKNIPKAISFVLKKFEEII